MLEIYERIKARREELGLTQLELAKRMGYKSKSSINKIETGVNDIPQSKVIAFARALETTTAYLMGVDSAKESFVPKGFSPLPGTMLKPRLGTIACGDPILADQNVDDYDRVPDWIECDFTLQCRGDSMIGARIYDGDIVCIRQQPEVLNGEIAAVLIDGEATLKRVYVQQGRLTLMPENPSYQPLIYVGDELENIRIIGKATYFISKVQ